MSGLTTNGGCSVNYDASAPTAGVAVSVAQDECLDPESVLSTDSASFIWASSLTHANKVALRSAL